VSQGAALDSVQIPAGTFVVYDSGSSGGNQWDVDVQSQAGGFFGLSSSPSANLPLTGSYGLQQFLMCDPFDPMCFGYVGDFYAPVDKIGAPGPGFEGTSSLQHCPGYSTVATYQWDAAPWTVTVAGNQLQAESLGAVTCRGSLGSCPGAKFGAAFTITLQLDPGQTGPARGC
jgi:hypothetical protein